jgi:hypothetical protein
MGANAGKEDPLVEVSIELFKLALMCFGGGASLCALGRVDGFRKVASGGIPKSVFL